MRDDTGCRQWVDSVMRTLNLRERIGQLFVYTLAPTQDNANVDLLRRVVKDYKVGGLLFSSGEVPDQVALTNLAQEWADVPLMITLDGEWGLAMRLKETPRFPRNMILGCIRNDSLLYEYGREVARECREMGIHVNFAPVADVNINPSNPVINTRSFGEDPANVARKVVAYARGLEDGGVVSVAKHFPGHGDTNVDSHKALPTLRFSRERLDSVELYPFRQVIEAGLNGIMVGHLAVPAIEGREGIPASLSRKITHDLLIDEFRFKGLVFTDALAMKGVSGNTSLCLEALKAGHDQLLVPRRIKEDVEAVLRAVKRGELSEEDIAYRCRKVLTYKYALGLNRKPFVRLSGLSTRLNTPQARDLVRRLSLAAVTVLGNEEKTLPLDPTVKDVAVVSVGNHAELMPFMQTLRNYAEPERFDVMRGMSAAQCAAFQKKLASYRRVLVCVTEDNQDAYRTFFETFAPEVPVVYVLFVQGYRLKSWMGGCLKKASAVVLAHSSDEDVQRGVADILYGVADADGRLSASIGGAFAAGEGVTIKARSLPRYNPDEHGMDAGILSQIDDIVEEGIRKGAFPGCQVVVWKDGHEMFNKAFGTQGKGGKIPVEATDAYDLASLTKMTATLLAVMKLYDQGLLNLTDYASTYLPFLKETDKARITIRELLMHESGLPSTILFYQDAIDKESYTGPLFKATADRLHTARIGHKTWGNPHFRFREGLTSPFKTDSCTVQVSDSLWLRASFKEEIMQKIADARLLDKRYRYSCVGFILLQQVVEARTGLPMDEFLRREFYGPMGLTHTGFRPLTFLSARHIVPTSADTFLRKTTLRGFVHDESAAFLGGVSGNAGLFSNASEVAALCQLLLDEGVYQGKRYLSAETCHTFTTQTSRISRRGLGFDKPDQGNARVNPCCESAPASVYGHTGFTGTCAWVDPDNGLVYVFLSNRISPDVWNNLLSELDVRERIQETIYRALRTGK
ncbi:glycoside hydrolase family 3 N-terminal domain-containing protein [uncultured Bacteroides sp.]|uniref:glycoside hydrolase family 3 N-terminal domain-containing protein n=1 Tax=uncultured Bacteroides sp. TaxID=162156 RepID=UPI0026103796|nr:glycoside hydrolase family 3 N-terminal domain-containing protein [uncultured Bacteroides sp.]